MVADAAYPLTLIAVARTFQEWGIPVLRDRTMTTDRKMVVEGNEDDLLLLKSLPARHDTPYKTGRRTTELPLRRSRVDRNFRARSG